MTLDRSHCPFSPPQDIKSAVYFGHLLAKAEQMSGITDRTDHLALIWLAVSAWNDQTRLWRLHLDGLKADGVDYGNWRVSIRTSTTDADPVGLHRRDFLAEEGVQILALASPFMPQKDARSGECSLEMARKNLAEAAAMRLILSSPTTGSRYEISDLHGNHADVTLEPNSLKSKLRRIFSH
jgi:hypothetical protein